jgi:iron(III) transport system substrate-binding protein
MNHPTMFVLRQAQDERVMDKRFATIIIVSFFFISNISFAKELRIVTSLDPLEAKEYIGAFEKETDINVQWIRLSAGEALARIRSEGKNPTQDIWFGAPVTEYIAAKKGGFLEPYSSATTRAIPSKWRDRDDFWTGIYFGAITFVTRNGYNPPVSWEDLLKPEYKGEIVVSYPYTAGTGFTVLSGIVSLFGEEKGISYYQELDKQIRRYTKSGGAPIIEVGLGEANVGIVFDQDALRKGISRGFPISLTYPKDGVPYEIGAVAIIRGGNKAAASSFIDWVTSLSGQNLMHKWYRVPLHPKAIVNERSKRPDELPLINVNFETIGQNRGTLIDKWRERVGK